MPQGAEPPSEPGKPVAAFPSPLPNQPLPDDFKAAVSAFEKAILEQALFKHRHNQRLCAKALGLTYDQLRHAMRKAGLLGAD
jgi:psp operon transcriptional activator